MSKLTRLAIVLGILAAGIAAIGTSASISRAEPKPSGQDDTGLTRPSLGL